MNNWKTFQAFNALGHQAMKQQHLVARLIGLTGQAFLPPLDDFSHTNLYFHPKLDALSTKQIEAKLPVSFAFSLSNLRLLIIDEEASIIESFHLHGKTFTDGFQWILSKVESHELDPQKLQMAFSQTDSARFTGSEIPFSADELSLELNKDYRENADLILQKYSTRFEHASAVKIWPHHFDSATYIPLGFNEEGAETHSIGLGFSIPDSTVDEPYFYINLWSQKGKIAIQKPEKLKGHGEWVTEGWQGATLRLSVIVKEETPEKQWKRINRFFETGILTILNSL